MPTPLHRRLWVVVAAALLPTAALSAVALKLLQEDQKNEVAQATIDTMRAMVGAVDSELDNTVVVAQTLAVSSALDDGDMVEFHREAERVARKHPLWVTITLSDRAGQQLVNVLRPLDAVHASDAERSSFRRVVATGKPAIGDLVEGDLVTPTGFAVRVPVIRGGLVVSVITVLIAPESMLELIRHQRVPSDGVVSIFDSKGNHVARSRHHERFLGQKGSKALQRLMRGRREGWGPSITLEGQSIYAAFSRSAETGWSVAVGIPSQNIETGVTQSFATVAFGLLLSVVLGVLASLMMARLVTAPIKALRNAAQAVGRGELPEVETMRIAELDEVARALVGAARARTRAEEATEELLERERVARAAAEQANRSKDDFLAMLGHELRNPLAAISNAIQVIGNQPGVAAEPQATELAQRVIRRQVEHLVRLVDDLLDVARVVSGKVILARRDLDLEDAVRNAIATLDAGGHLDNHQVVVRSEPVWVHADATRIEQIVTNLVVNAVKYTPHQGRIAVTVERAGDRALIHIRDEGVGIDPELLPQIFDLFTQGQQALDRAQGGLGIGLTLVRRLAELHDGSVKADSSGPGRGSTFTVELPAIPAPNVARTRNKTPDHEARHVLIVEDNDDARDMLQTLLQMQGHRVDVAASGPDGVAQALADPPEVALVDLGLPGFDGFEVARRIRAQPGGQEITLVALSGYGSEQDKKKSKEAGFDRHLVKPVGSDAISGVLARSSVEHSA